MCIIIVTATGICATVQRNKDKLKVFFPVIENHIWPLIRCCSTSNFCYWYRQQNFSDLQKVIYSLHRNASSWCSDTTRTLNLCSHFHCLMFNSLHHLFIIETNSAIKYLQSLLHSSRFRQMLNGQSESNVTKHQMTIA